MSKKIIALTLVMMMLLGTATIYADITIYPPATSVTVAEEEIAAKKLQSLGLFKGTNAGFELERAPSRVEGLVMLVRLLGKESEAQAKNLSHPFTDVPSWANSYVGYAYSTGLTKGIGETTFGSANQTTRQQYAIFVLRALGYNEKDKDFTYESSIDKAQDVGIAINLDLIYPERGFTRGDAASMSFSALDTLMKNTSKTLIRTLIDAGAVKEDGAKEQGLLFMESAIIKNKNVAAQKSATTRDTNFFIHVPVTADATALTSYVRLNNGDWQKGSDINIPNFNAYPPENKGLRTQAYVGTRDIKDAKIDVIVTYDLNGDTFRTPIVSYKTAPKGLYAYNLSIGYAGNLQDGNILEYILDSSLQAPYLTDNVIYKWYASDTIDGPYELVLETPEKFYKGDATPLPISKGQYFFVLARKSGSLDKVNGDAVNQVEQYK